jgi:hypothetical protein
MFPGSTTKITTSALVGTATLNPKTDLVVVSGVGPVNTITPNYGGGFSGILILVPTAALVLGTTGNILVGATLVVNRATFLVYVKSLGKWVIQTVV